MGHQEGDWFDGVKEKFDELSESVKKVIRVILDEPEVFEKKIGRIIISGAASATSLFIIQGKFMEALLSSVTGAICSVVLVVAIKLIKYIEK